MAVPEKLIEAVRLLYGDTEAQIAVCGEEMELLWESGEQVKLLYPLVLKQLQYTNGKQLVLPTSGVLMIMEKRHLYQCRIHPLRAEDKGYYLLVMHPQETENGITSGELRALFSAYSTDLRLICSDLVLANDCFQRLGAEESESGKTAVRMIQGSIYQLLNQSARCAELAWYESFRKSKLRSLASIDVSAVIVEAMEQIRHIMGDYLTISYPPMLYELPARVDAERLHFALLNIFVMLHDGNPNRTEYTCTAERKTREIRIVFTALSKENARTKLPQLHKPRYRQDMETVASAEALLDRFCKTFRATVEFSSDKNAVSCVLRLPSHKTQVDYLSFSADRENFTHNRFSLPYLLLSAIVDFPTKSK